jgi:hypothetical protein
MTIKLTTLMVLFLVAGVLMAEAPSGDREATKQVCQLVSANPPDFHPSQFVPVVVDDQQFKNRRPKVAFVVNGWERGQCEGSQRDRLPRGDAGLVKSIQTWKYKPQAGCMVETSMVVILDI